MKDPTEVAREFRETYQQAAAILKRLDDLVKVLEQEAAERGSSGAVVPYDEIVREWNARCAVHGMKRRNTAGELKAGILRVWRKYPNLDSWRAAFDAVARNSWWRGEGGWQGTLESFIRPVHYGKFFDEGLGAAAPAASGTLAVGAGAPEEDPVEAEIDALLADKTRPLPSGFAGRDPREVRGKDDEEFLRRLEALKTYIAGDWRFGA